MVSNFPYISTKGNVDCCECSSSAKGPRIPSSLSTPELGLLELHKCIFGLSGLTSVNTGFIIPSTWTIRSLNSFPPSCCSNAEQWVFQAGDFLVSPGWSDILILKIKTQSKSCTYTPVVFSIIKNTGIMPRCLLKRLQWTIINKLLILMKVVKHIQLLLLNYRTFTCTLGHNKNIFFRNVYVFKSDLQ